MKKIKLFLASSFSGIEKDRVELGAFVDSMNERYEQHNVYFQLIMDGDDIEGSLTNAAGESDLFYIVFHSEAPKNAIEEFNAAYEQFVSSGEQKKPKITTYFKKVEDGEPAKSVIDFMERLDKELGHYYNNYTHIDTLKLNISLQLESLGLDEMKVELDKDGRLCLDDIPLDITLDNIPMVFNNSQLTVLKRKYEDIVAECKRLRKDDDAEEEYEQAVIRRNEIKKEINNLQKDILDTVSRFLKSAASGYVTPRMKAAMKCLEDGDIAGALQELDAEDMKLENELLLKESEILEMKAQAQIDEWLARVQALKLNISNQNRFTEIEQAYEQAIMLEKRFSLPRKTLFEYSKYLSGLEQNKKAIDFAEEYLRYLEFSKVNEADCVDVISHLTRLHLSRLQYEDAARMYRRKIDICKQLFEKDMHGYKYDYAGACKSYAVFLRDREQYDDAEEFFKQAVEIYKLSMRTSDDERFDMLKLVESCISLADFFETRVRYDDADELYDEIVCTIEKQVKDNPSDAGFWMYSFNRIINALENGKRYEKAEKLYQQRMNFCQQMAESNFVEFGKILADTYKDFASYLSGRWQYDEAEKLYRQHIDICKQILDNNSDEYHNDYDSYVKQLMNSYYSIADTLGGKLYGGKTQPDEADKLFRDCLEFCKQLVEKDFDEFYELLLQSYNRYISFLEINGRYDDADELHEQELDIKKKLADKSPNEHARRLAFAYSQQAILLESRGRCDKAEELYRQSLDIYEKLSIENPNEYLGNLASAYSSLAESMKERFKYDEAESFFRKELDARKKETAVSPDSFNRLPLLSACRRFAEFMQEREKYDDAEAVLKQALDLQRPYVDENPGENLSSLLSLYYQLAELTERRKSYDDTENYLNQGLEILKHFVNIDPNNYLGKMADLYVNQAHIMENRSQCEVIAEISNQALEKAEEAYKCALEVLKPRVQVDSNIRRQFARICELLYDVLLQKGVITENETSDELDPFSDLFGTNYLYRDFREYPDFETLLQILDIKLPGDVEDLQDIEYP